MPNLVGTFGVLAGLALLATILVVAGVTLPAPYSALANGGTVGFALFVYFSALVSLAASATSATQMRELFRSKHKAVFVGSVTVVILYCALVSGFAYLILNSEL
jgi:hypothetical protein